MSFTCASIRAVHLEVVTDLKEDTFILAFSRFASRKSLPKVMISDNATRYIAAAKEMEKLTNSPLLNKLKSMELFGNLCRKERRGTAAGGRG